MECLWFFAASNLCVLKQRNTSPIVGAILGDVGMKSEADFKAAWASTAKDKQDTMMKECQDAAMSKPHAEFCANLTRYAGNK